MKRLSGKFGIPGYFFLYTFFILTLFACAGSVGQVKQTTITASPPSPADTCAANPDWLSSPSLPGEVASPADNCNFQQFMWQSLFYLVQPSSADANVLNFETWMPSYGLFVGEGESPASWGSVPVPDYCSGVTGKSANYIFSNLTLQAGSHVPLIDQAGNDVFYGVIVNKTAYDFITSCDLYKAQCSATLAPDLKTPVSMPLVNIPKNYPHFAFPDQAIELKTSWKILTSEEINSGLFYTTQGAVQSPGQSCQTDVTLGLVGIHIVSKTPNHPEFIWATFEHKNNAPNCDNTQAKPPLGGHWNFFNQNCSGDGCITNEYKAGTPTQVCRMHPWGDPTTGTFPNNLNCQSTPPPAYICEPDIQEYVIKPNTQNIMAINQSVDKMLQALPAHDPNKLWANYELVGNVWTNMGALPPNLQSQRGSLASANTSMETFVQNGEAGVTNPNNCFSCHNMDGKTKPTAQMQTGISIQLPPAGIAHIFNLADPNTTGCGNGTSLPAACPTGNN